jgi:hypothetical protein
MPKTYRAQIIWDFEVDENGYTESELEFMEYDLEDGVKPEPRTEEDIIFYVRRELVDALYNSVKHNDLSDMVNVVVLND